jgi:hypothetical protein
MIGLRPCHDIVEGRSPLKHAIASLAASALTALPVTPLAAQSYPLEVVQFVGGLDQNVEYTVPAAVVFDGDGKPLFRASRAFLLAKTGNASGRVFAWDLTSKRVRVSLAGKPQMWLACSELKAMTLACSTTLRIASDGALVVSGTGTGGPIRGSGSHEPDAAALASLPNCPGDPRCP